jgi:large-conductance mechanosensitive channel
MENQVQNPNAPTTARLAIKWGAICGVLFIIYTLITYLTGLVFNEAMQWVGIILTLGIIGYCQYAAMGEYKNTHEGFISYGQGLGLGTMLGGVSGVVSGAFSTIYNNFIDPSIMVKIMEKQKDKAFEAWEKQGISESQAEDMWEKTQGMMGFMQNPGVTFLFSIVGSLIFAFIIALIVSAIQKKDKPVF